MHIVMVVPMTMERNVEASEGIPVRESRYMSRKSNRPHRIPA